MAKNLKFLIAIDNSKMAETILKRAMELVSEHDDVTLLHVIDNPNNLGQGVYNYEKVANIDKENAEKFIKNLLEKYPIYDQVHNFELELIRGNPTKKITFDIPKEHAIDYIIIGKTTRDTLMDKIFIGSTAKQILAETPNNVILIKE